MDSVLPVRLVSRGEKIKGNGSTLQQFLRTRHSLWMTPCLGASWDRGEKRLWEEHSRGTSECSKWWLSHVPLSINNSQWNDFDWVILGEWLNALLVKRHWECIWDCYSRFFSQISTECNINVCWTKIWRQVFFQQHTLATVAAGWNDQVSRCDQQQFFCSA